MVSTPLLFVSCPRWGSARVQPGTNAVVSLSTRIDPVFARPSQPLQPAKRVVKVETVDSSNWGPRCGAEREGGKRSFPLHCRATKTITAVGLRGWQSTCGIRSAWPVGLRDSKNLPPRSRTMELCLSFGCCHSHTVGWCSNCSGQWIMVLEPGTQGM